MKRILLFAIVTATTYLAKSQEIVFKMNQAAGAIKNSKTGKFANAEVSEINQTIVLQKNKVILNGENEGSYTLARKIGQTKINNHVVSYSYNGKDEKNGAISFVYTVDLQSKEAIVEVGNKDARSYYFGTYSSLDVTGER